MKARFREILDKSIAAMVAAIEVYNKPDFRYREEVFSVIAVNAWELAFKAYILKLRDNKLNSLYVYEKRRKKDGTFSKKLMAKRNKSGNPFTHSIKYTLTMIESLSDKPLPEALKANISALTELRDNAIHFYNKRGIFAKRLQELGSATLKNYHKALQEWFEMDLSQYNFYLMPISFFADSLLVEGLIFNKEGKRFLDFIDLMERQTPDSPDYDVTININVKFVKATAAEAIKVQIGRGEGITTLQLTEEQIRERFPWDYAELVRKMKERYKDFKIVTEFHELRKAVLGDERYVKRRYLDPAKPQSGKKDFYNPRILNYFDKYYSRV